MSNIEKNFEKLNYKDLISIESLQEGLSRTKSGVSLKIDCEVKKTISEKRLVKLHKDLAAQSYQPTPSKHVGIPKPGGGTRFLDISSQIDKVIQGALLNKLEPIFEKIFIKFSFGFVQAKIAMMR